MTLEFLQNEMKQAMKIGDTELRDIMRSVIGSVKKTVIDERCDTTEELVDRVLLKEAKILQEQYDTCPIERQDLLEVYARKLAKIKCYLPQMMSEEEIRAVVIRELAAAGIEPVKSNKGAAMKMLMPLFKGKADMKLVNQIISEELE